MPNNVTIKAGNTVKWTNADNTLHTVTSRLVADPDAGLLFDSMNISPGGTFSHTFNSTKNVA